MPVITPIDSMLDSVDWVATDCQEGSDGVPVATHEGVFKLGELSLRCYRLSDGRAVFHADDMRAAFPDFFGAR